MFNGNTTWLVNGIVLVQYAATAPLAAIATALSQEIDDDVL